MIDGIEATRRIVAAGSPTRVIILTTFDIDKHISTLCAPEPRATSSKMLGETPS